MQIQANFSGSVFPGANIIVGGEANGFTSETNFQNATNFISYGYFYDVESLLQSGDVISISLSIGDQNSVMSLNLASIPVSYTSNSSMQTSIASSSNFNKIGVTGTVTIKSISSSILMYAFYGVIASEPTLSPIPNGIEKITVTGTLQGNKGSPTIISVPGTMVLSYRGASSNGEELLYGGFTQNTSMVASPQFSFYTDIMLPNTLSDPTQLTGSLFVQNSTGPENSITLNVNANFDEHKNITGTLGLASTFNGKEILGYVGGSYELQNQQPMLYLYIYGYSVGEGVPISGFVDFQASANFSIA